MVVPRLGGKRRELLALTQTFPRLISLVCSQNGEDGVLLFILRRLMGMRRLDGMNFFEFGAENGAEVNTRLLRERYGVSGLMVDIDYENLAINLRRANASACSLLVITRLESRRVTISSFVRPDDSHISPYSCPYSSSYSSP